MFFLAYGATPAGPTDKLCPSEEPKEAMADRGPDGSMVAQESRCARISFELTSRTEPLVYAPLLLRRSDEPHVSTRDRPARTGADARIEKSGANGEVRLALRPHGRNKKAPFRLDV
jgi:hypothetical protein